jgi:hypothetical protein
MTHVGVGWAIARVPWLRRNVDKCLAQLDPLLGWLAIDGYGFQSGFFHAPNSIGAKTYPNGLSKYARRVFDQGLGRSLWFVEGADVSRISLTIASFHNTRRADLWSGIGLASAYAGGADGPALECLREAAKGYITHMAQGAAFAAKARAPAIKQSTLRLPAGFSVDFPRKRPPASPTKNSRFFRPMGKSRRTKSGVGRFKQGSSQRTQYERSFEFSSATRSPISGNQCGYPCVWSSPSACFI